MRARRVQHPVAREHLAFVGEVDRGHLELLLGDVLPHVELGPVGDREHAHVLAPADPPVVEAPQLGALPLRLPLAELVAKGQDPLLRTRALLVAAGAAEGGVEIVRGDRVEQGDCLQPVARGARPGLIDDAPLLDRVLHRGDDQAARRSRRSAGRGTRSPRGSCAPYRRASPGTESLPAETPSRPDRSSTIESLPPLNNSTGRSNSAADSRSTCTASASKVRRWDR